MPAHETAFRHNGVLVEYKRRAGRLDRRHLIVMFTGLRPLDAYDFDGRSSRDSQAHWLWIKDKFDGYYAYTVCRNMDHGIEHAVMALIDAELARLGLTRNECTLAGISKGGFPALYYGIKYNFRNIVATAPQVYVGTHARQVRPKIFAHMTGGGGDREQELLDALIPEAVAADRGTDKNIYLFSSAQDQFHQAQIVPALPMFAKYPNFNYIESDSDLVWNHAGVIRYNLPLMLSILYAAAENAPPRFGMVRNGNRLAPGARRKVLERQRAAGGVVVNLSSGRLAGPRFFPEGTGFLRGHAVDSADALSTVLVLAGSGRRYEFPLAADRADPSVSFRYYEEAACDYNRARFASPKKLGIDLSQVPAGSYELLLRLVLPGQAAEVPLRSTDPVRSESHLDGLLYRLRSDERRAVLDVRPVVGAAPKQAVFRLRKSWARGPLVHLDGDFAVRGVQLPDRKTGSYYLVLRGAGKTHARALVCGGLDGPDIDFGDGLGNYAAARFSTPRKSGVDVSGLRPGRYDVAVTLSCAGAVYTLPAGKTVQITVDDAGTTSASIRSSLTMPLAPGLRAVPVRRLPRYLKRHLGRRMARLLRR
ncbi:accessory Sec system protein Asp2 [Arthrobacter mobilis]|uniref:Uncharacterized protein n=1 Tax=Arthrobacter mobilis TaxID=2724944 RepID=A0A7X6K7C1_9MICC|nr:accessory Sec system protein Asp2 [Arthrobacter mobilis]NKX56474.1 hypothetical protein [Arthrobacter mobilis]